MPYKRCTATPLGDSVSKDRSDLTIEDIALDRLRQLVGPLDGHGKVIRFPLVFGRICSILCINKRQAWKVLRRLETQGSIEIVPYQGIRIPPAAPSGATAAPSDWYPTSASQRRILKHLRAHRRAYPSDIARALHLDIDTVISAARRLQREGLIDA